MKILIVGGSGSGKSEYAERLAVARSCGDGASRAASSARIYIATMEPFGAEGAARIARHREMRRERGFTTIERFTDLRGLELPPCSVALLEDIGNLAANELFSGGGDGEAVSTRIVDGALCLAAQCETLIVVSNDILRAADEFDAEMQQYLAIIGTVNRRLAREFDEVYEVAAGSAERVK